MYECVCVWKLRHLIAHGWYFEFCSSWYSIYIHRVCVCVCLWMLLNYVYILYIYTCVCVWICERHRSTRSFNSILSDANTHTHKPTNYMNSPSSLAQTNTHTFFTRCNTITFFMTVHITEIYVSHRIRKKKYAPASTSTTSRINKHTKLIYRERQKEKTSPIHTFQFAINLLKASRVTMVVVVVAVVVGFAAIATAPAAATTQFYCFKQSWKEK